MEQKEYGSSFTDLKSSADLCQIRLDCVKLRLEDVGPTVVLFISPVDSTRLRIL